MSLSTLGAKAEEHRVRSALVAPGHRGLKIPPGDTAPAEDEERGYPRYHAVMLTKVLVYACRVGVFSSRKIQRRLVEDIAFRLLAAGNEPDCLHRRAAQGKVTITAITRTSS